MIVTLRTADRQPQPDRADGADSIHHLLDAQLLAIDSTFPIRQRVTVKARSDLLVCSRARQKIPRDLLDGELVIRHVAV